MDILQKKHSFSQTEKCAFFEKIFREHKIALVDSHHVSEVRFSGRWWYRKDLTVAFSTLECTAYKIGRCLIVWKGRSDIPIFLMEEETPFEVFSAGKYDFFIRKEISGKDFCFERCKWLPSEQIYIVEQYAAGIIPKDFLPQNDGIIRTQREWLRMYPHEDIETKSVDNTIFYEYIVKFWQD